MLESHAGWDEDDVSLGKREEKHDSIIISECDTRTNLLPYQENIELDRLILMIILVNLGFMSWLSSSDVKKTG